MSDYDQQRYGASWLAQVSERYRAHSAAKMEQLAAEERQRMEEERKRLVEAQRVAVHEKAKKLGYQIKESRQGETVQLVSSSGRTDATEPGPDHPAQRCQRPR